MFLPLLYIVFLWFQFNRYKKKHLEIQEKIKPCITWAKAKKLPIPTQPHLIEMFLIENRYFWYMRFPIGLIVAYLPVTKKVQFYQKEINKLWKAWEDDGRPRRS